MRVKVSYRGQIKELEFEKDKITALELLKALSLSREYAFVVKGEEILEERDLIEDEQEVRVINAISGGIGR